MIKRTRVSWFVALVMLVTVGSIRGKAYSTCVINEIKVAEVKGVLLLPNKLPISDATVELHKKNSGGPVIALVRTDEAGRFRFATVAAGKYVVIASYPMLVALHVPVRVTSFKSHKQKEIVIILNGLIGEPCGGGDAYGQVVNRTELLTNKKPLTKDFQ